MKFEIAQFNETKRQILLVFRAHVYSFISSSDACYRHEDNPFFVVFSSSLSVSVLLKKDFSLLKDAKTATDKRIIHALVDAVICELVNARGHILYSCAHSVAGDLPPKHIHLFNKDIVDSSFSKVINELTTQQ